MFCEADLGMDETQNPDAVPLDHVAPLPVSLAIFFDPIKLSSNEEGYPSPALEKVLAEFASDVTCTAISLESLLAGGLDQHTCICIPGGFAHNYASALGVQGIRMIRDFVAAGGGYIGICAGAYLGSTQGLDLLPVECVDVHRWARGSGPCQLHFTAVAHRWLGATAPVDGVTGEAADPVTCRYANGPMLRISGSAAAPLATFATEFRDALHAGHRFGSRLEGSPAVVLGRSAGPTGGVVALVSPHLEDATDHRALLPFANMVRLTARGSFYQRYVEATCGVLAAPAASGSSTAESAASAVELVLE